MSEITKSWDISEAGGHESLRVFIDDRVNKYRQQRDIPSVQGTSRLSPYLHFGQLSPHQAWHAVSHLPQSDDADTFLSELGWREFSYSQLYYHPDLSHENVKKKYDAFPWINDGSVLSAWKKG